MRYPIVLVDVGGTLVGPREPFGTLYARVLRELGVRRPTSVFQRALEQTMTDMEQRVPPGKDRYRLFPGGEVGYWQEFARNAIERALDGGEGPRPAGADGELAREAQRRLRDVFRRREAWEIYADVLPALERLRADGVRLGVISNWDSRLPELLQMLDLAPFFEVISVSHLEGVEKPDPGIFAVTLEKMGAHARQALYVGDRPEIDLEGARAAGMDGVIVNRGGRLAESTPSIPDFEPLPGIARNGL